MREGLREGGVAAATPWRNLVFAVCTTPITVLVGIGPYWPLAACAWFAGPLGLHQGLVCSFWVASIVVGRPATDASYACVRATPFVACPLAPPRQLQWKLPPSGMCMVRPLGLHQGLVYNFWVASIGIGTYATDASYVCMPLQSLRVR